MEYSIGFPEKEVERLEIPFDRVYHEKESGNITIRDSKTKKEITMTIEEVKKRIPTTKNKQGEEVAHHIVGHQILGIIFGIGKEKLNG